MYQILHTSDFEATELCSTHTISHLILVSLRTRSYKVYYQEILIPIKYMLSSFMSASLEKSYMILKAFCSTIETDGSNITY